MSRIDEASLEGRLNDGWAILVRLKGGESVRVCDHDPPTAVWERIRQAKGSAIKPPLGADDSVTFSGARAEANGKLDGFAIYPASEIVGISNFGPSAVGVGLIEARLAALEAGLAEHTQTIQDLADSVDELEGEDEEPEGAEGAPEGTDQPNQPIQLPASEPLDEAARAALASSEEE